MLAASVALRRPLMPWQRQVADVALELLPDGRLAYRTVVLEVMRQQGKTTLVLPVEVVRSDPLGCLLAGIPWPFVAPQVTLYTAQTGKDARYKLLDDQVPLLEGAHRALAGRMLKPRRTNGSEAVRWRNRSSINVVAPNATAGRGRSVDCAVLDEAMAHVDSAAEDSIAPTMLTRSSPQLWVVSSAGTAASAYLADKVSLGRAMVEADRRDTVAYFEWSAGDDDDPGDPEVWRACMPALGRTITLEAVAAAWETARRSPAGVEGFKREYLSVWTADVVQAIPPTLWREARLGGDPPRPSSIALAAEVDLDRTVATIALAGDLGDGVTMLEVVDRRPGTGWVLDRLDELARRYRPHAIALDAGGPASALVPDRSPFAAEVDRLGVRDVIAAAGAFHDDLVGGRLRVVPDDELDAAIANVRRRPAAGAWLYDRRAAPHDASAGVAVVLARFALRGLPGRVGGLA